MPVNSFDSSGFLLTKLRDVEAALEAQRAEKERLVAERGRIDELIKEVSSSIAAAESDQLNYARTIDLVREQDAVSATTPSQVEPSPVTPVQPEASAAVAKAAAAPSAAASSEPAKAARSGATRKASTSPKAAAATGKAAALPSTDRILAAMAEKPRSEWTVKQLQAVLPDVSEKVVSNSVQRLYKRAQIDRVRTGRYRIARSKP